MPKEATKYMPPVRTRFQKGQSGNPGGRPGPNKMTLERLVLELRIALNSTAAEFEAREPTSGMQAVAKGLVARAAGGDVGAIRLIVRMASQPVHERAPSLSQIANQ